MLTLLKDKRIVLSFLVMVVIAVTFWTGSRYPALNEKAAMAGEVQLEDPLSFETLYPVLDDDPIFKKIALTAANWLYTNRQGMTFGVMFAAAFMTLVSLFKNKRFRSGFANTLLGVTVGTPLGVCVNCAAPLARGMHVAGMRLETTLAAMISSPTLNVIVLTMLFSLFPLYMALLKLGATFFFILIMIPLLCRFVFKNKVLVPEPQLPSLDRQVSDPPVTPDAKNPEPMKGWWDAFGWIAREYPRNLWFIVKTTGPFMLLAGLLGAAAVTILPWEHLVHASHALDRWQKLLSLGLVSLLGLFLPVPIAFDLFICSALLSAGMPAREVMVLLFTLGVFSVYSFFIVGRALSWRVAGVMSLVLVGVGVASGVSAHYFDRWDTARQEQLFFQAFSQLNLKEVPHEPVPKGENALPLMRVLHSHALTFEDFSADVPERISVDRLQLQQREGEDGKLFSRRDGHEFGIHEPERRSPIYKFLNLFTALRGIAAGDVHNDGWADLLIGSSRGVLLYANVGGERFTLQRLDIPKIQDFFVSTVSLADLNNDGWLDIFLSTFRQGNYVIYNQKGRFPPANLHALPQGPTSLANAAAFGDLDQDGDLDVILGNNTTGLWNLYLEESRNMLLRNTGGTFRSEPLPGMPGETLSTLLSDINTDGHLDLMVGNDFDEPDVFYINNGEGDLLPIRRHDRIFPHTTRTTMSIDSADIDNDLNPEIYIAQISRDVSPDHPRQRLRAFGEICDGFAHPERQTRCTKNAELHKHISKYNDKLSCLKIEDESDRLDCIAIKLFSWVQMTKNTRHCDLFPDRWADVSYLCRYLSRQGKPSIEEIQQNLSQIGQRNVFFIRESDGYFADKAEEIGLDLTGWTWNAKFADVDNDEWQDLFAVNGFYPSQWRESNVFFQNKKGRRFVERTEEAGLTDFLATGAYTYVDMDNDGDLDIITVPFDGPLRVYRNQSAQGHSIAFQLRDRGGNRFGIGSKIIIHYGPGSGRHQIREIKAGGGYLSFDPPIAYFGLGDHKKVERVEVQWSTGDRSELRAEFAAGFRYRITRAAGAP